MLHALAMLLLLADPSSWEQLSQRDGVTVSRRPVKGSDFYEYRATAATPTAVPALCDKVFEWATRGDDVQGVTLRRLLKDGPDERVVYDQVSAPVVSNRDYAMVVRRARDTGACHIHFQVDGSLAPKLPDGFVRITKMTGSWDFEPAPGGTRVTYTLFAEPGGSVPAFLVNGTQKDRTAQVLRQGIEKARAP